MSFTGVFGALAFGGGFAIGGLGVLTHSLPLLYLGYGVLGGLGMGFGYVPPVATLLRWFPDRRGMATGLTIMGFGGGALVTTPIMLWLLDKFKKAPTYVGPADSVNVRIVFFRGANLGCRSFMQQLCPSLRLFLFLVGGGKWPPLCGVGRPTA